ncbi:paxillin-related [Holotrichia oblita]|uniref:Paxillin-related n=2 Tax=Holotrichia oblita TaxID=644536 RepID=A0ACB9TTZ1_HOLOL|nr:paxillin-related [Holotrichia oblita]KAI4470130.1 paxillin-related [Holotrichia oblita]
MPDLICALCEKVIEGQVLTALEKTYHPNCFVCTECKKPITGGLFQIKDDKPYCQDDYAQLFAPKCYACNKPITDRIINALGHTWHQDHFICALCKVPIVGQNFIERDGRAVCQKCFEEKIADKCKACGKPVVDKIIVALDAKWHADCFKCKKCDKPITQQMFQVEDGFPICAVCATKSSE